MPTPRSSDFTLVADFERLVDGLTAYLIGTVQQINDAIGERPFGAAPSSPKERLRWWASNRDNLGELAQVLASLRASYGPTYADNTLIAEATALEWKLARRGGWEGDWDYLYALRDAEGTSAPRQWLACIDEGRRQVLTEQAWAEVTAAEREVARIERVLDKPAFVVTPPLPPLDPIALITNSAPPPLSFSFPEAA